MRAVLFLLAAAAVAGCAQDMTSPAVTPQPSSSLIAANDSVGMAGPWRFGRRGMGFMMGHRLPSNLQLTDAQRTQIRTLMMNFRAAHQSDFAAMRAAMKNAMQAARAPGQRLSPDQRLALLQQTAPARQRLMTAQRTLAAQIQNVLTTDQKAWLAAHRPAPCANADACRARFSRRGFGGGGQMRNPS